jgi:hypothetical protein
VAGSHAAALACQRSDRAVSRRDIAIMAVAFVLACVLGLVLNIWFVKWAAAL